MPVLLWFKEFDSGLYALNTAWYTLRAQREEQVGRSLLESNSNLHFRITSELSGLSFDPGEESPNTTEQRAR